MLFNQWIDTFVSEKEIDESTEFTIDSKGVIHFVSIRLLIEFIKKQPNETKRKIKETLIFLDFRNADILDYFNFMAKGYIKSIGM